MLVTTSQEAVIYQFDLSKFNEKEIIFFNDILSTAEKEKAVLYVKAEDKINSIISRALLRIILSYYINVAPCKIIISTNEFGKPFLKDHRLYFNISHSKNVLAIAVSLDPVGIDIEYIDTNFDYLNVTDQVFTSYEQLDLARTCPEEKHKKFFHLWTKKESILKAIGFGFYNDPREMDTINQQIILSINNNLYQAWITSFEVINQGFLGSVCRIRTVV